MSRVIVFANQKGGVGKTTTVVNLAAYLAKAGRRVLVIDLDPQGNATSALGYRGDGPFIYDVLVRGLPGARAVARLEHIGAEPGGVAIMPASSGLAGAEVELVAAFAREHRLRKALSEEAKDEFDFVLKEQFDFVLIDCPPSLGLLTVNALTAADEVIVPVQCEYLALEGLAQLTRTIEMVRQSLNPPLRVSGVVLTMFDSRTNLAQQVADEVRNHYPITFKTIIPRSVRLSEAPSRGLPISLYDPTSRGALAYEALAAELLERIESPVGAGS